MNRPDVVTSAINTNAATNLRFRCEPRIPRRRSPTSFQKLRVTTKIRIRIRITITAFRNRNRPLSPTPLREARDRGQEQEAADRGDQHDADPELAHAPPAFGERKRGPSARSGQRTRVARGFVGQGGSSDGLRSPAARCAKLADGRRGTGTRAGIAGLSYRNGWRIADRSKGDPGQGRRRVGRYEGERFSMGRRALGVRDERPGRDSAGIRGR